MTIYAGGQGPRPFEDAIRRWSAYPWAIARDQVPAWTTEDEANLRRRVQRMAAKGNK